MGSGSSSSKVITSGARLPLGRSGGGGTHVNLVSVPPVEYLVSVCVGGGGGGLLSRGGAVLVSGGADGDVNDLDGVGTLAERCIICLLGGFLRILV